MAQKNNKILHHTFDYVTYSPTLRRLSVNKEISKITKKTPYSEDWMFNRGKHGMGDSLRLTKRLGKEYAMEGYLVDQTGTPVSVSDIKKHRFYTVKIPPKVHFRLYSGADEKRKALNDMLGVNDDDDILWGDILYAVTASPNMRYGRHKRVTKGKKSHRS